MALPTRPKRKSETAQAVQAHGASASDAQTMVLATQALVSDPEVPSDLRGLAVTALRELESPGVQNSPQAREEAIGRIQGAIARYP